MCYILNSMQSMDNTIASGPKDNWGQEDSLRNSEDKKDISGDLRMNCSELSSKMLAGLIDPRHAMILNVRRIQAGKSVVNDSLLRAFFRMGNKIPRHVVTRDEIYLRCCLELIHVNAAKGADCSISLNLSSVKMGILAEGLNSSKIKDRNACGLGMFVYESPLEVGTGSLVTDSAEPWIAGSIMGSRSMANILKKLGAFNIDPSSDDGKLGTETPFSDNHKYEPETMSKSLVSMSSISSTCADQSYSSTSTAISQGMLQCTWEGGIPYFVFSVDNQREVYVANLSKEGAARNKGLDYVYLFHSSKSSHKEHRISDNESQLVGKLMVSNSFSICPQDSKIMETKFVLFGVNKASIREVETSSDNHRKNKGLSKKVVEAFKSSHSTKQRLVSDALDQTNHLDEQLPTNQELIAIVVRDHFRENPRPKAGGWGLKFIEKPMIVKNNDTLEASVQSVCSRNTGECSTSMNVLIPAGIHGGQRTRNGSPSSLIERWRSGGHCDCGGWDLGCRMTVLKTRSSKGGGSPPADTACKLFDYSIQGPDGSPTLTILNVRADLYFIDFQSTLSALQSFSIAVAYIHTRSPSLRPNNVPLLR